MDQTENQLPKVSLEGVVFGLLRSARRLWIWLPVFVVAMAIVCSLLHPLVAEIMKTCHAKQENPGKIPGFCCLKVQHILRIRCFSVPHTNH